jgi:ABC-2 type transport system ATP-binding protein
MSDTKPAIVTRGLSKVFRVAQKEPGLLGSLKSLVNRQFKAVPAAQDINLTIQPGELVGFIGPNGAGKTTTLKMLAGLLYPTSGTATILGYTPWERPKGFLKQFSLVMGQKQQLWWDLPLLDSLLLQRDIYEVDLQVFTRNLNELTELLALGPFLKTQVRRLSLGQRMRGELAASLIYEPKVLFLDEPTIGLDVVVQERIRKFIKHYQKQHQATILLTSHYLDDVRELAERVIIIDHGRLVFDDTTQNLINRYADHKEIILTLKDGQKKTFQVPRAQTSTQAAELLTKYPVEDISIAEPSLENIIRELFSGQDYA